MRIMGLTNNQKCERMSKANKNKSEENNYAPQQANKLSKEVLIIAQEVKIVKALACNNAAKRNKQVRKLHKWLQLRSHSTIPFTEEDFLRIWKGLYYSMWYSDKPLVQEELAEQLAQLLQCFGSNVELSINFFGAFLQTMRNEWFGIDQWRIDKFLMLVRRMLRYMFKVLQSAQWSLEAINEFNQRTTATTLKDHITSKGLCMHYLDIFFEELAKVSEGNISAEQVDAFLKPFITFVATQKDFQLVSHCQTRVFHHLLFQSRLGREYSEKYNAWKALGFPSRKIADLEKIEDGDANNEAEDSDPCVKKHLDPRAGNVDVHMPELPLQGKYIITELEQFLYKHDLPTKRRKMLKSMLETFRTYEGGTFPLGVKTMPRFEAKSKKPLMKDKIKELDNLENELYGVDRKLKQLNKRKRRRLLKSLNFEDVDENNYEQTIEKALPKAYLLKRKHSSVKAMMSGWLEEELDEWDLPAKQSKKNSGLHKSDALVKKKCNKRKQNEISKSGINKNLNKLRVLHENQDISVNTESREEELCEQQGEITECEKVQEVASAKMEINEMKEVEENAKSVNPSSPTPTPTPNSDPSNESKLFTPNGWDAPLEDGEEEFFIPSRKLKLNEANNGLVRNPMFGIHSTPLRGKRSSMSTLNTARATASAKRVRIVLKHNTSQHPREYIQQIKSSPNVPFDANKKPSKGLLKPNSTPSPINPFYRKKIGLKLFNDTL